MLPFALRLAAEAIAISAFVLTVAVWAVVFAG